MDRVEVVDAEVVDSVDEWIPISVTRPGSTKPMTGEVTPEMTFGEITEALTEDGFLSAPAAGSVWELREASSGQLMTPSTTVGSSGLAPGAQLVANTLHTGAGLSPELLTGRLRHDEAVAARITVSEAPVQLTGFHSMEEARQGDRSVMEARVLPPSHYRAEYTHPVLADGSGRALPGYVLLIDLLGGGSYPATPPRVKVLPPVPFAHRVSPESGVVCMGDYWVPNSFGIAETIYQVGRYMNLDEPAPAGTEWDHGYNRRAADYWESELGFAPVSADLCWPRVDAATQGARRVFRKTSGSRFRRTA